VLHVAVTPPDGPVERQTFCYSGHWWRQDAKAVCRYEERDAAAVTTLKVAAGTLTLLRQGEITCRQSFRAGEAGRALYRTPYGIWPMAWRCRLLDVRLSDGPETAVARGFSGQDMAVIRFSYDLELGGQYLGLYDVLVEVGDGQGSKGFVSVN
jgi:uncharacterized beta-barrel protein YwiB (DUF1934 family)